MGYDENFFIKKKLIKKGNPIGRQDQKAIHAWCSEMHLLVQ